MPPDLRGWGFRHPQVQARDQGRYLGGRPPYGYRLVDAGPHPNRALARRGVQLRRLDTDPETGPIVTWMFQQRLAGHSTARITRALNEIRIPCPAAADHGRNPHRTAVGWTLTSVQGILSNPRYTGRQVWNRQRTDHELIDPDNTTLGHRDVMRRNTPDEWVISEKQAHPALVSEADFVAAQAIRAQRKAFRADVPARRAAALRALQPAHGVVLVERPRRLPLPTRAFECHAS